MLCGSSDTGLLLSLSLSGGDVALILVLEEFSLRCNCLRPMCFRKYTLRNLFWSSHYFNSQFYESSLSFPTEKTLKFEGKFMKLLTHNQGIHQTSDVLTKAHKERVCCTLREARHISSCVICSSETARRRLTRWLARWPMRWPGIQDGKTVQGLLKFCSLRTDVSRALALSRQQMLFFAN